MSVAVQTIDLAIGYKTRTARQVVLDGLNLTARTGEMVCLLGTNGTGKSTLLRTLARIQPALSGSVKIDGRDLGQLSQMELARRIDGLKNFVYASSSSVYGANTKVPFDVADEVEKPQSLYAATKRSDELIAYTYAHLYGLPCTGLRFFTVYGPWGRPDMAYYSFTRNIIEGKPIRIFNHGEMWRDFTYIDDIVQGTVRALGRPASGTPPHAVYNLGNCRPQKLTDFVSVLEDNIGLKASLELAPMQAGDVTHTFADIEASRRDLGFEPVTPIETGLKHFVGWYRGYHAH